MSYHFHFLPTTQHKLTKMILDERYFGAFDGKLNEKPIWFWSLNTKNCPLSSPLTYFLFLWDKMSTIELNKIEEVTERYEKREDVKTSKQNQTVEMFFHSENIPKSIFSVLFSFLNVLLLSWSSNILHTTRGKTKRRKFFSRLEYKWKLGLRKVLKLFVMFVSVLMQPENIGKFLSSCCNLKNTFKCFYIKESFWTLLQHWFSVFMEIFKREKDKTMSKINKP